MTPFSNPRPDQLASLVSAYPLALVISDGPEGYAVTPLPLIAIKITDGAIAEFEGHFARRNRQVAMLQDDPRALLVFQGPHRYIPPDVVADPDWAPTWNYAIAQFEVEIRFTPEQTRASVERLMDHTGPQDWRPATHIPGRYAAMLDHIVAFRARVVRSSAKFKLGQDEQPAAFSNILDWLGDEPLADWMRGARGD